MNPRIPSLALLVVLHAGSTGCDAKATIESATPNRAASPTAKEADKAPADKAALDEAAVKKFVTGKEEILATGVGSAHKSVKVEFLEIRIAKSRVPNEQDKIDGVRGDAIYPVRVKYKSVRTWGNGETVEKTIHYGYDFYRDEFGEWNAIGLGPVK